MNKTSIVTMTAILVMASSILGTLTMSGTAFAQFTKDPGASGLTPKEEPKTPGWDPNGADEDAPGRIIGPESPKEVSPGQEGLKSGIIGPE